MARRSPRAVRSHTAPAAALRAMQRAYALTVERSIREWFAAHRKLVQDAADPAPTVLGLVDQAMRSIESSVDEDVAKIERIKGEKAAGGAPLLRAFRKRNVELIKTVDEATKARLDKTLERWGNLHVEGLTSKLLEAADVSRSRARFWARDQALKLNAAITRAKHESLGIVEYDWVTSNDGTVRPSHAALNGKRFRYDDPPETGTGRHNPGEDYQCRCHADPVLETVEEPKPPRGEAEPRAPARPRAPAPVAPRAPVRPRPAPSRPVVERTRAVAPPAPAVPLRPEPAPPVRPIPPDVWTMLGKLAEAPVLQHAELSYLRTGIRPESLEYAVAQLRQGDPTMLALLRDPIVIDILPDGTRALVDGRHRLIAAQAAGALAVRATFRAIGARGAVRAAKTAIVRIDRSSPIVPDLARSMIVPGT